MICVQKFFRGRLCLQVEKRKGVSIRLCIYKSISLLPFIELVVLLVLDLI